MADIDKGLPNTRTEIKVPSEEELAEARIDTGDLKVAQKDFKIDSSSSKNPAWQSPLLMPSKIAKEAD